ncbi:MAG: protein kinase domain-containing protein [Anaerolineae bacterium]
MSETIQEIKGYQLQDLLGEGGFGTVYRAYQPLIRREVAIKVIRSSYANRPEFIRRFEAEAQLVARLEHLHIVPLYDFWRDPTGAYLVMRMLRGGSLREELQARGRLPLEDIDRIITQISSALSIAHRKGIVHRDLKPANILLDEDKNAYLTDFGIAKDVEQTSDYMDDDEEDEMIVGTPAYSPPEQLQSLTPTPQSDIYSFGLIVYELITGQDAMSGDSISAAIRNQLYEPLPEIDPDVYGIPMVINEILATATAKDPDERYISVMHFSRDFSHALANYQVRADQASQADIDTSSDFVVVPDDTMSFSISIDNTGISTGSQVIINPYKGLRAFQESDSDDFYGRSELTDKLLERLQEDRPDKRFLAVIGPSGSGKSSVVKAGVIPAIRRGALPSSEKYYVAEMVPGADALEELESILLSIAVSPPDNLREILQSSETGLFNLLEQILPDDGSELFLLIDQFEEVFTQTEDNRVRTHFMNSLQYAITHPDSRLRSVITIRADFYDKPLLYPQFGELVRERSEIVLPLSRQELEAAIVQPAKSMGIQMEQELVEQIITDVQEEPGALPLLQYALTELFDRRSGLLMTLETYKESGGVLGSLARRAEELYLELDESRQEAVRQMFLRLVTLGEGTEDTRRRVRWSELAFHEGDDDPMADVRDLFTKYRLLTGDNDPQTREPTIEVAHEALIRQWQRLRNWLADNRENIRTQRQVVAAVSEWQQNERDSSFLASGMRLNQFELLLNNNDIALTIEEKAYIQASIDRREAIRREEEERQARERALEERARRNLRYLVGAMAIGLVVVGVLAFFALQAEARAVVARDIAEREALENNSISLSNLARFWGRAGEEPLLGLGYAIEANNIPNPPVEVQQTLAEIAWQPGALRQFEEHENALWGVAYSADGETIFSVDGSLTTADGNLFQWSADTGEMLRRFENGHADRIYSVAASADGRYVATGSQDTDVIIWDVESGAVLHTLEAHSTVIFNVMFTHDSTRLISGGGDAVIVWDVESGEMLNRFDDLHGDIILDMDITADDQLVFSGSFDGSVRLWRLDDGSVLQEMNAGQVTGARFFPGEIRAVTTDQSGELIIWDLETGERLQTIRHDEAPLRGGVVVTSDGEWVMAGDDVGNVLVWDLTKANTQPIHTFRGHNSRVPSLDIHPDGTTFVTVSFDRTSIVWDLYGRHAEIRRFEEHDTAVYSAITSADGRLIASGSVDGQIIIRDMQADTVLHDLSATDGTVYALAFNVDASVLASAHEDGTVTLWDTATGEILNTLDELQAPVRTLAFSPDDRLLAFGGGNVLVSTTHPLDNRVMVWDRENDSYQTLDAHRASVRSLAFTADSQRLLSASDDRTIMLWSLETGDVIRTYEGHQDAVWSVAFNVDSSEFLSGSRDTTIIRWNTESGEILERLDDHQTGVRAVAFHPDGVHAVSGGGTPDQPDYVMLYWDVIEGEVLREMPGHSLTIRSLTFNADGSAILSASDDARTIMWHADTLDSLITRIGDTYQVACVPEATNDVCETIEVETDQERSLTVGFPLLEEPPVSYAEGSLCLLPDEAQSPPNATVDTSIFAQAGPYVVGYSNGGLPGTSADWIASWARYEADNLNSVEQFRLRDASGDLNQQVFDIQSLVLGGVDVLIVNPVERSASNMDLLEDKIQEVVDSGIPVILVGNRTPNPVYTAYVGHDPFEIGCVMAQELTAIVDGEGPIGVMNAVDLSVADVSFKEGERTVFSNYPSVDFTAEGSTDYQRERAFNLTSSVRIEAILGYASTITLGAQDGVNAQNLPYVPFVSDHAVELAQFALINDVEGIFVRSTVQMGAQAVQAAIDALEGETLTQFVRVAPSLITTDDLVDYDLDNAPDGAYLGDWEDLPESYYP